MGIAENYKHYAADCVRQSEGEQSPEDKNILLNMALAWVRLAQQAQLLHPSTDEQSETTEDPDSETADVPESADAPQGEPERKPN